MKSVLMSIQPYWLFLIIANKMGWKIKQEKTVEVRKNCPKAEDWDRTVKLYCSKDKKSFNRIPQKYQPLMERFLGKVIGEFVCDKVYFRNCDLHDFDTISLEELSELSCVSEDNLLKYADRGNLYGWHISNLVIYDKPRELSEFKKHNRTCYYDHLGLATPKCKECKDCQVERPPQSWCYVESEVQRK